MDYIEYAYLDDSPDYLTIKCYDKPSIAGYEMVLYHTDIKHSVKYRADETVVVSYSDFNFLHEFMLAYKTPDNNYYSVALKTPSVCLKRCDSGLCVYEASYCYECPSNQYYNVKIGRCDHCDMDSVPTLNQTACSFD